MVLGLSSSGGTIKIVLGVAVVLYVYLWLHDKDKAMAITRAIGKVFFALTVGVVKFIMKFFEGLYRLIFK